MTDSGAKRTDRKPEATDFFWRLAEPFLAEPDVDEGSLMGFPCVRASGQFFCTCDHRTGHLIVKLPKKRVDALVAEGVEQAFAPAGRVFKEWVLVERRNAERWTSLMNEARDFVATQEGGR